MKTWAFAVTCLAPLALPAASAQDEEVLGASVDAEAQESQEKIDGAMQTFEGLVQEIKTAVAAGQTVPQAIEQMQRTYEQAGQAARSEEAKAEIGAALEMLRSSETRQALEATYRHNEQRKVNAEAPAWLVDFAERSQRSAGQATEAGAGQSLTDTWERQAGRGGSPPERPDRQSRWRTYADVEGKRSELQSQAQGSSSLADQVRQLNGEASRQTQQIRTGEKELNGLRGTESDLVGRLAATGSPVDSAQQIEQQLQAARNSQATLKTRFDKIESDMKWYYDEVTRLNGLIEDINRQMDADPTGFYNSHRADCEVIKEWEEQRGDETVKITQYRYRPATQWTEQANQHRKSWDSLNEQRTTVENELDTANRDVERLSLLLEGARNKEKLDEVRRSMRERSNSIENLRIQRRETVSLRDRALARLKTLARQLEEWVRYAKEAAKGLGR